MILGLFCCALKIPKMLLDFCNVAGSRFGGAPLKMNTCALPCDPDAPEADHSTRLKALKKFAWNCKFIVSVIKKRFEIDKSSFKYQGIRNEENRLGAFPNWPGSGAANAAGLM